MWLLVGFSAAALTSLAFIPQIMKVLRTKSVKDVSVVTLVQFLAGVLLWTAYGIHLSDIVIIAANIISIISLLLLLFLYWRYSKSS